MNVFLQIIFDLDVNNKRIMKFYVQVVIRSNPSGVIFLTDRMGDDAKSSLCSIFANHT